MTYIDWDTMENHEKRLGDYDFCAALRENSLGEKLETVKVIALQITGERDEEAWHWIVELVDGKWAYVTGSCDYTGWDCRSGCDWHDADTRQDALTLAGDDARRVFEDMLAKGETERPNTGGL